MTNIDVIMAQSPDPFEPFVYPLDGTDILLDVHVGRSLKHKINMQCLEKQFNTQFR